ncbi:hypothetical protein Geob_3845 [Geotalea daltonii FRC-32]|uniref:Uncharacterized protein n=1 Tax=Geotalea daltonii (strain DSM 22248 / JCM 15807 / FRC-32) TaxID=316067 RepID=A0A068F220_GEODF|nr:hypothetical protein Geob_3845 [Geotalea daltonii FRC-32]
MACQCAGHFCCVAKSTRSWRVFLCPVFHLNRRSVNNKPRSDIDRTKRENKLY